MRLGTLFGLSVRNASVSEYDAAGKLSGYLRVAFPVWTIPGVRIAVDVAAVEKTSRQEIEALFSLDLRRARLGGVLSPNEIAELLVSAELRAALYNHRIAA